MWPWSRHELGGVELRIGLELVESLLMNRGKGPRLSGEAKMRFAVVIEFDGLFDMVENDDAKHKLFLV